MEITSRNQIIPYKKSTQFLGITLHRRLNWKKHIDIVRMKAKRALNTIKVIASKKWKGDQKKNSFLRRTKKLDSTYREVIRIYKDTFRGSPKKITAYKRT